MLYKIVKDNALLITVRDGKNVSYYESSDIILNRFI